MAMPMGDGNEIVESGIDVHQCRLSPQSSNLYGFTL